MPSDDNRYPTGIPRCMALTHFRADKENLAIKADHPAVVIHIAVANGETNVQEYAIAAFI